MTKFGNMFTIFLLSLILVSFIITYVADSLIRHMQPVNPAAKKTPASISIKAVYSIYQRAEYRRIIKVIWLSLFIALLSQINLSGTTTLSIMGHRIYAIILIKLLIATILSLNIGRLISHHIIVARIQNAITTNNDSIQQAFLSKTFPGIFKKDDL